MKKPKVSALPPRPMPKDDPKQRSGKMQGVHSTTKNRKY